MDYTEDRRILLESGFTRVEIDQLSRLRKNYREKESLQAPEFQRRLEFVRWLVTTGRLTDQLE